MIVLGADTHKRSHTVGAVAAATGELLGEQTVPVGLRGFGALLRWARSLDGERAWALEDCRHVSGSLERFLIERGERVLRIPTHLTANARRSARQRGKSDPIDALNVARAALREGLESFPAAHLDGPELDLRLLVDNALFVTASSSTARCSGTSATSGPSSSCQVARCSRRSGARGSRGAWPGPSRRCASGSRATSCAGCASSPRRSRGLSARSPSSSGSSHHSCSASRGSGRDRRQARRRDRRRPAPSPHRPGSPARRASHRSRPARATPSASGSTEAETARSTRHCTA